MKSLLNNLRELRRYPSSIAALVIITGLFVVAAYAIIKYPYSEAVRLWRGGEEVWYQNPRNAPPLWTNWFSEIKKPVSFALSSESENDAQKTTFVNDRGNTESQIVYTFDYNYDEFPQEIIFYFTGNFVDKQPFASIMWTTPDGREIRIADMGVAAKTTYRFSQDTKLERRVGRIPVMQGLFLDPAVGTENPVVLKGTYKVVVDILTFEPNSSATAELVLHGSLHGWAGTDHQRRDLMLPLLWGTPIALAFGLAASVITGLLTMIIAAVGVWYAGWVDELIQRITEINLVLPFLSILIMVGTFYSRSIWVILGVTILLSIFTGSIKGYRAIFMQVKESTYIEAARAYGASNTRIIFLYLIPRIVPLLIPGLVSAIPAYVFLEASLAVLGLGDPVLPTWGKVINDAQNNNALYNGFYYWMVEPAIPLMITGLGFAMLGFSLDRIFNPRLRGL